MPDISDRLSVAQKAVLSILAGFDQKRLQLGDAQLALINILRDAEGERTQLETTQRAILNILEEADQLGRNLTEARDQAEEANQAKSRFLTGITHELRTPLHGILGYAELLNLEGDLNQTQSERVAAMMAAGEHLLGTINAVLDMSQIEADQVGVASDEIELTELARVCLEVVRPAAEGKGAFPGSRGGRTASPVRGSHPTEAGADQSARQRRQVHPGRLDRSSPAADGSRRMRTPGGGRYRPRNLGQHHDKLFQTFERLNANAMSGIEGAGLGLAISARLVQFMGGRIGHADNPGGGSVFWLELPVNGTVPVAGEAAAPTRLPQAAAPAGPCG